MDETPIATNVQNNKDQLKDTMASSVAEGGGGGGTDADVKSFLSSPLDLSSSSSPPDLSSSSSALPLTNTTLCDISGDGLVLEGIVRDSKNKIISINADKSYIQIDGNRYQILIDTATGAFTKGEIITPLSTVALPSSPLSTVALPSSPLPSSTLPSVVSPMGPQPGTKYKSRFNGGGSNTPKRKTHQKKEHRKNKTRKFKYVRRYLV